MANLQLVCQQLNFTDFYGQLKDFAESQQINFDFSEVGVAHQLILSRILEDLTLASDHQEETGIQMEAIENRVNPLNLANVQ
jgi:hypothetical protein